MYTVVEKVLFLQKVDLLSAVRTEDLALLASIAEEVLYPEATTIFEEGQPADGLYVIIRGEVILMKDGDDVVALEEGEALVDVHVAHHDGRVRRPEQVAVQRLARDLAGLEHYAGTASQYADGVFFLLDQWGDGTRWDGQYGGSDGFPWSNGSPFTEGFPWSNGYPWSNGSPFIEGFPWSNGYPWTWYRRRPRWVRMPLACGAHRGARSSR